MAAPNSQSHQSGIEIGLCLYLDCGVNYSHNRTKVELKSAPHTNKPNRNNSQSHQSGIEIKQRGLTRKLILTSQSHQSGIEITERQI